MGEEDNKKDLNHIFIKGTWKEFNDHVDEVPVGSIVFCEDEGKIMLKVEDMNDMKEEVDKK